MLYRGTICGLGLDGWDSNLWTGGMLRAPTVLMIKEGDWVIRWVTTYQEDLASFMAKMCQGLGSRIRRVGKSKKESPLMPYCLKQHTNTVSQSNWRNTLGYIWWNTERQSKYNFKIRWRFRVFNYTNWTLDNAKRTHRSASSPLKSVWVHLYFTNARLSQSRKWETGKSVK